MKIDYAIHSSDSNPFYLDFWKPVSKIWKTLFGITPVLIYIDDNHDIDIDTTHGKVVKMKPVKGVPIALQCLWVRYWFPSTEPEKVSIISDIDMIPISKKYFQKSIENIPNDKYVHLNPFENYLPSCYHVAKGSRYKEVLKLHDTWEDSVLFLNSLNLGYSHCIPGIISTNTWGSDEKYATECIQNFPDRTVFVFIKRSHDRVDRSNWTYDVNDLFSDRYADSHSIRPYSIHKNEIDKLIKIVEIMYAE